MSYMIEVFCKPSANSAKEAALTARIAGLGGSLDFREEANAAGPTGTCLTYEFPDLQSAESAAQELRRLGEFVEGPVAYGETPKRGNYTEERRQLFAGLTMEDYERGLEQLPKRGGSEALK